MVEMVKGGMHSDGLRETPTSDIPAEKALPPMWEADTGRHGVGGGDAHTGDTGWRRIDGLRVMPVLFYSWFRNTLAFENRETNHRTARWTFCSLLISNYEFAKLSCMFRLFVVLVLSLYMQLRPTDFVHSSPCLPAPDGPFSAEAVVTIYWAY